MASILGGALLAAGWLMNVPTITPAGEVVILAAHALLGLGLVGIYLHQADRVGALGLAAFVLGALGSRLLTPSVALMGSLVPEAGPALHEAASHGTVLVLSLLGPLLFSLGMALFGWCTWRAGTFAPRVGAALMVGIAALFAGAALRLGQHLGSAGAAIMGYGFIAAGVHLWRASPLKARQA